MKKIKVIIISLLMMFTLLPQSVHGATEEEVGRSNVGSWNGGTFYEYVTKEFLSEDNASDTVTYRIRYKFKHQGGGYCYQSGAVGIYVDGAYITQFGDFIDVQFNNQDRVHGTVDVTMSKGVNHIIEARDMGAGATTVNVSGTVFHPLPTYNVSFVDNLGDVIANQTITKYQNATYPTPPIRTGYTFTGWTGDNIANVTNNRSVIANYTINQYAVTFKDGLNGNIVDSQTINHGSNATLPKPQTHEGYTFTGWSGSHNNVTSTRTITANYEINKYDVVFWDGLVGGEIKREIVNHGSNAAAPTPPKHDGYLFDEWTTLYTNVTSNRWVIGKYNIIQHDVTFIDEFDNSELKKEKVDHGFNAIAPTLPNREGYTFVGWVGEFTNVVTNVIIKAQWSINEYQITFDSVGGTPVDNQKITYNEKIVEPSIPVKKGFIFEGWQDSDGNKWNFNDDSVKKETVLSAKWRAIPTKDIKVKVDFNDNNNQLKARPEAMKIQLLQSKKDSAEVMLKEIDIQGALDANTWFYEFQDMQECDESETPYTYAIKVLNEDKNYIIKKDSFDITCELQTIDLQGQVIWDMDQYFARIPKKVDIQLLQNNQEVSTTEVKDEGLTWIYQFSQLLKYDPITQKEYVYTVSQNQLEEFTTVINHADITNTFVMPIVDIEVKMIYEIPENAEIPVATISLIGEEEFVRLSNTESKEQAIIFNEMPLYDTKGITQIFTLEQEKLENFKTSIKQVKTYKYEVINTYVKPSIDAAFEKTQMEEKTAIIKAGNSFTNHAGFWIGLLCVSLSTILMYVYQKKSKR